MKVETHSIISLHNLPDIKYRNYANFIYEKKKKCSYLQDKEAGVEDAGIDEDGAEPAALEELIRVAQEEVVRIQHHHPIIIHQAPGIQLVQRQLEPVVKIVLFHVWVLQVLHHHNLCTIFIFPAVAQAYLSNKRSHQILINVHTFSRMLLQFAE